MNTNNLIAAIREPLAMLGFDTIVQHDLNLVSVGISGVAARVLLKVPETFDTLPVVEFTDYFGELRAFHPAFKDL